MRTCPGQCPPRKGEFQRDEVPQGQGEGRGLSKKERSSREGAQQGKSPSAEGAGGSLGTPERESSPQQEEMASGGARGGLGWNWEKFLMGRGVRHWHWGRPPIPGGI